MVIKHPLPSLGEGEGEGEANMAVQEARRGRATVTSHGVLMIHEDDKESGGIILCDKATQHTGNHTAVQADLLPPSMFTAGVPPMSMYMNGVGYKHQRFAYEAQDLVQAVFPCQAWTGEAEVRTTSTVQHSNLNSRGRGRDISSCRGQGMVPSGAAAGDDVSIAMLDSYLKLLRQQHRAMTQSRDRMLHALRGSPPTRGSDTGEAPRTDWDRLLGQERFWTEDCVKAVM